jgi:transposase
LILRVRRFRCLNDKCVKQTFVERLPEIVAPYAQRTSRLNATLKIFADNLSAKTGARLLKKLKMAVSPDSLLRILKQGKVEMTSVPRVLGVDDFAFRRNHTYGTLLIDLETHRPVDLLPDRRAATLIEWLKAHPGIEIISRDRSTEYSRAILEGAPQARVVADRWHVIKNLREALERLINRLHASLSARQKAALSKAGLEEKTVERFRNRQQVLEAKMARLRRQHRYQQVVELYQAGHNILEISQQLGLSRSTIYTYVGAGAFPERAKLWQTKSMLDPYLADLEKRWAEGGRNAKQLWQELVEQGYQGSYKTVRQWAAPRREQPGRLHSRREENRIEWQHNELANLEAALGAVKGSADEAAQVGLFRADEQRLATPTLRLPAAKHLVWLLLRPLETLKADELKLLDFMRQEPALATAYDLAQNFLSMVRTRASQELENWLAHCEASGVVELENFGAGLWRELGAIKAALSLPYSNGPTEGQVNKLKMIKRTLYGRGSFEGCDSFSLNS